MWVQVMVWMLADDEPPMPVPGSLLRAVGIRVRGVVTAVDSATPDGVVPVIGAFDTAPPVYRMTGVAGRGRDDWISAGRRGGEAMHAGSEFILAVGADRFLVQSDGRASEVVPDSHVTVTGSLELVGEYEWDGFALSDTRADWTVEQVVPLPQGDILVDLDPYRGRPIQ